MTTAVTNLPTLRLCTAGSVDDGKSTFVGRLLYDTKSILSDQYESVERVSTAKGLENPDLSLLVDGLRAEREQGITIDVAYRYFATDKRSFILADTPGHVQYTRNTVTGLSTSELVIVLIDARNGVIEQTRRHLRVASMMKLSHVVVAVNKIDAVDYSEEIYNQVADDIRTLTDELGLNHVDIVPPPPCWVTTWWNAPPRPRGTTVLPCWRSWKRPPQVRKMTASTASCACRFRS